MINFLKELKEKLPIDIYLTDNQNNVVEGFKGFNNKTELEDAIDVAGYKIKLVTENEYILKAILNSINEGVLFVDCSGKIRFFNSQLSNLEALQAENTIGKTINEVYHISQKESEHFLVRQSGNPIIDRFQQYSNTHKIMVNTVASTYPVKKDGQVLGSYSIARNEAHIRNLLKKTKQHHNSTFIDLASDIDNFTRFSFENIISKDERMLREIKRAKNFAKFNSNVLIYGETGVGKELFAQGIHNENTITKRQPFIALNCSAIPENLLESMLFGTTKGAYTGAENRKGLIEEAGIGTLFLDELNTMPLNLQAKLLRVIQEEQYRSIGGNQLLYMRCKILSSTNIAPDVSLENGTLRPDLYYRLSVNSLRIPALRERHGDIPLLSNHFLKKYGLKYGLYHLSLSNDVLDLLEVYKFSGNVRELENIIESAITQVDATGIICRDNLPDQLKHIKTPLKSGENNLKQFLLSTEKSKLIEVLNQNNWNISASARSLGIARQNLQYRVKKLNITQ